MKEISSDLNLVAKCGLYCGACRAYLKGKCPGCAKKENANWCQVRKCCLANNYATCADCTLVSDCSACKKLNNFISKIFAFVFRSDRNGCVHYIKQHGVENFVKKMVADKTQSIKK